MSTADAEEKDVAVAALTGAELHFVFVNPRFLRFVGDVPVVGRPLGEVLPQAGTSGLTAGLTRVLATGEPWDVGFGDGLTPTTERPRRWRGQVTRLRASPDEAPMVLIVVSETTRNPGEAQLREASERYERKRKLGAIKEELDYLRFLQDLIAVEVELCRKSVIPAARTESRGAESNENE